MAILPSLIFPHTVSGRSDTPTPLNNPLRSMNGAIYPDAITVSNLILLILFLTVLIFEEIPYLLSSTNKHLFTL